MKTNEINTVGMGPACVGIDGLKEALIGIKELLQIENNSIHESYTTAHDMNKSFGEAFILRYNKDDCTPEERAQLHIEMERLSNAEANVARMENEEKIQMFMALVSTALALAGAICNAANRK